VRRLRTFLLLVIVAFAGSAFADTPASADNFPKGHGSAEGAVADLARAFINGDARQFREAAARPFGGGDTRKEYEEYLASTESKLGKSAKSDRPSKIVKVYAARHLSRDGPASHGHASFGFKDVMFVDVMVGSSGGEESVMRVLAVQESTGEWHALPAHWLWPLLSDGLAEESKPEPPPSNEAQQ